MRYLDELDTRKVGEREWILLADFRFESDIFPGIFIAPKGMRTNFASIPRILWRLYPPVGNYDEAAVIHDGACRKELITITRTRINCVKFVRDKLFREALLCETFRKSKVGPKTAKIMYLAIKHFGE